jgi:ribosomal subunit interface protein
MTTRFYLQLTDIDDKTRTYIVKRLSRVEKLVDSASKVEVEVGKNKKGKYRVEVMIRAPRHLYRAEETSESVEASMDLVMDKLETEITRDKDRRATLKLRGARSIKKKVVIDTSARF